ncbi:hypothetical protein ACWDYH_00910 [Nocardia goodfellowii]|uniref:Uncharacterized protein n=1 Tax=Nocardia goodfellowii TaxID=882446 RepID=A0ABS4QDX2_9NOCA|nr:hypothetical protein [Nocardia goodfellowii]MBP2189309.1 hypothetical protein [Nocardia goodfellowii]
MKVLRGFSGLVAAGTFVLALVVVAAAFMGARRGFPGPGGESVAWHVATSILAISAQIFADRRRGFAAFSGSMVVFVASGLLLWTQWWS